MLEPSALGPAAAAAYRDDVDADTVSAPMLARVSPRDAADSRLIHRARAAASLAVAGRTFHLNVLPLHEAGDTAARQVPVRFGASVGLLCLSRPLLRGLLDLADPGLPDTHRDIDLLLELLLAPSLARLEEATARRVSLCDAAVTVPRDLRPIAFRVTADGVSVGDAVIRLAAPDIRVAADLLDRLPPAANRVGGLRVPLAVVVGLAELSLGDLRTLRRDDVVLSDLTLPEGGAVVTVAGQPCWGARRTAKGFEIAARPAAGQGMPIMKDTADQPAATANLEALTVRVVFEVGRTEMALSDLQRMRPGYIVELGGSPALPVDLTVRGQVIGKAELVQVGDTVGARILRLFDHG